MTPNTDWLSIYRSTALDATQRGVDQNKSNQPVWNEPVSLGDAIRSTWSGENWLGRPVTEVLFDRGLHQKYVAAFHNQEHLDEPFDPREADFTGVGPYREELAGSSTWREFYVKRETIRGRMERIETAGQRNGVLHTLVGHLMDPTLLVGYGVARAGVGVPARIVGARVAAVETGIVAAQQGAMAAAYADRSAGDAVRMSAYAGVFSFVLGTGLAKAIHGRKSKLWSGGHMNTKVRKNAAAARQTTTDIIAESAADSAERAARVDAVYAKPLEAVSEQAGQVSARANRILDQLGMKAEDATEEALDAAYKAGDKGTRQKITRLRRHRRELAEFEREQRIFELEKTLAKSAQDSERWQSNAMSALVAGRKGLAANMLPRVTVVADSPWERGIDGLPDEVNAKIGEMFSGLREGARRLTRSHGMDTATGELQGANVEDIHLLEISQIFREDEGLRTAAIHAISGSKAPTAFHTPVVRNIKYQVGAWFMNKAGELPAVLSGGRLKKIGPLQTAEDQLEKAMQSVADQARISEKGALQLDHIDMPDAVKELFRFRQGIYQNRIGRALRDHELSYVQRELSNTLDDMDRRLDELEAQEWRPWIQREIDDLNAEREQIMSRAEAYMRADDPLYQPVSLMAHKVRGDYEGFIEAAEAHFRANPRTKLRNRKRAPAGPTRTVETAEGGIRLKGRAIALWHATVWRVDFAGRPVGRKEFLRKLETVVTETLDPKRVQEGKLGRIDILRKYDEDLAEWHRSGRNGPEPTAPPAPKTPEDAAIDTLHMRMEGMKRAEELHRSDAGGRYVQSEMFETAALDPKRFRNFIEDRPTVQFKAYVERELRRVIAAERMGDPDAVNPMIGVENRWKELGHMAEAEAAAAKAEGRAVRWSLDDLPEDLKKAIDERVDNYDLLRRQQMGEVLFEGEHAFIDNMNKALDVAANISTSADLGMAGYSVTIDLGQMLAYYGMGPVRLAKVLRGLGKDREFARLIMDPSVRHQLGVSAEISRGARLRAIQGADSSFGNQGGFVASGHYWQDMGRWIGNFYGEAASNVMTASLLSPITDLTQALAAPLATTRVMQAVGRVATGVGKRMDANILRRLGMDDEMATRIWAQYKNAPADVKLFAKGADELTDGGAMIMPKFSEWTDAKLAQDTLSMISGDIRVATLHPGIASNRIWKGMGGALQAVGRLYYLFTRWAMVSQANIFGKNIEDKQYRYIGTAMMYSTLIQAAVNFAKEPEFVRMGIEERLKHAFVMSGGFGYMGILNERLERATGNQLGLRPLLGIDTFAHDPDTAQFRMGAAGPVAGKIGAAITNTEEQQYGKLSRLFMPYQNWWLWAGTVRVATDKMNVEE